MCKEIIDILIKRDNMSIDDANEHYQIGMELVMDSLQCGDDPEEVFMQEFGLEPDYLMMALF